MRNPLFSSDMPSDLTKRYIPGVLATEDERRIALRTAFVARFIVLRESRKSEAHRLIERTEWGDIVSAEDLYNEFLEIFSIFKEELFLAKKDLDRALEHSVRSVDHFVEQYAARATTSFSEALRDYWRSNELLFGIKERQRKGKTGWKAPPPRGFSRTPLKSKAVKAVKLEQG